MSKQPLFFLVLAAMWSLPAVVVEGQDSEPAAPAPDFAPSLPLAAGNTRVRS